MFSATQGRGKTTRCNYTNDDSYLWCNTHDDSHREKSHTVRKFLTKPKRGSNMQRKNSPQTTPGKTLSTKSHCARVRRSSQFTTGCRRPTPNYNGNMEFSRLHEGTSTTSTLPNHKGNTPRGGPRRTHGPVPENPPQTSGTATGALLEVGITIDTPYNLGQTSKHQKNLKFRVPYGPLHYLRV